jgi:glycosyltransferase involved in cell wall biosynthesis
MFQTLAMSSVHPVSRVTLIAPDLSGGGVTRTYLLARVLQTLRLSVQVVGFQFGAAIYPEPPHDLPVHALSGCILPQLLGSSLKLLNWITGDIVYAIKPKPTSFGIALLKKLIAHRPLILDIDDWELSWLGGDEFSYKPTPKQFLRDSLTTNGALRQVDHPLYLQFMERLISQADAITVDTQFLQDRFGGTYLPNGKDTTLFDPQRYDAQRSRQQYGLAGYRVLMFPGTARPHKGLEDVLLALDQLNQPDLRLVIVGGRKPDNYDDDLMRQWGRWIIRLPCFPVEQMPEIVAAAHVIVVPQRDQAIARAQFPLKLTDGMAMAKPILATTVGDIPQILGDTGFLVPPQSPEHIAQQIQWIFDHPEAANQRGWQSRLRCIERYSHESMSVILAGVLKQLVHMPRSQPIIHEGRA